MPNNLDEDSIQNIEDTPESLENSNGVPSRSAGLGNRFLDFQSSLANNKAKPSGLRNPCGDADDHDPA